jgi:hypothetical protein
MWVRKVSYSGVRTAQCRDRVVFLKVVSGDVDLERGGLTTEVWVQVTVGKTLGSF